MMSQETTDNEGLDSESDVELDENDDKIIQLYDIINELVDDQGKRVADLELLYADQGDLVLQHLEERNNSLINQVFSDLQLKEERDEDDDDDDDSEDEQDEGWDIYNAVVENLNSYMAQMALLAEKMQEQREAIDSLDGPHDEEMKALEEVVEKQTDALAEQIQRNDELEHSLSSVLAEYSGKIDGSNQEIIRLHQDLKVTNERHSEQLAQMKQIYEAKIKELQQTESSQYKEEVSQLIDTLSTSRADFQNQIVSLTREMSDAQTNHHREMLKITYHNQTLSESLAEKTKMLESMKQKHKSAAAKMKQSLKRRRTKLDIDDDDEADDDEHSGRHSYPSHESTYTTSSIYSGLSFSSPKSASASHHSGHRNGGTITNGGLSKNRTFAPTHYGSSQNTAAAHSSSKGSAHGHHRKEHGQHHDPRPASHSAAAQNRNYSQRHRVQRHPQSQQSRSQSPHSNGHSHSKYGNPRAGGSGTHSNKLDLYGKHPPAPKSGSNLQAKYKKAMKSGNKYTASSSKRRERSGRK